MESAPPKADALLATLKNGIWDKKVKVFIVQM